MLRRSQPCTPCVDLFYAAEHSHAKSPLMLTQPDTDVPKLRVDNSVI